MGTDISMLFKNYSVDITNFAEKRKKIDANVLALEPPITEDKLALFVAHSQIFTASITD